MPLRLEPTTPASIPEIVSLLEKAFGASPGSPNFRPDVLRWKYYDPGPAWTGSRSYIVRKDDAPAAHVCAWPIRLVTPSGEVNAIQMLDWVSDPAVAGAGVALSRKLENFAPVLITCGGSEDTHKILPKIGFTQRAPFATYARVLRPWRQFRTRPAEGTKGLARLTRNTIWSLSRLADPRGWISQLAKPDARQFSEWIAQRATIPESRYDAPFVEFLLRCPAVRFEYHSLRKDGQPRGFFTLAKAGGQTRLADLRVFSDHSDDLAAAYAAAVRAAEQNPEACEVIAIAPTPEIAAALEANGFRGRGSTPVFVRDPQKLLGDAPNLHLSMLDDDSAFLNFPEYPYST